MRWKRRTKYERKNDKPQMPDVMEAIFDAAYLIFDLIAGILVVVFFMAVAKEQI